MTVATVNQRVQSDVTRLPLNLHDSGLFACHTEQAWYKTLEHDESLVLRSVLLLIGESLVFLDGIRNKFFVQPDQIFTGQTGRDGKAFASQYQVIRNMPCQAREA